MILPPPRSPLFPTRRSSDLNRLPRGPQFFNHLRLRERRVIRVRAIGRDHRHALAVQIDEPMVDRKSTRLNSSHLVISYAVFCLKKKKTTRLMMISSLMERRK